MRNLRLPVRARRAPLLSLAALLFAGACYGDGSDGISNDLGGLIGAPCGECAPWLTCDRSFEGGYCTQSCDGDCGVSATCYELDGAGVCLVNCQDDGDCRDGYSCQGEPGSRVCFTASGSEPDPDAGGTTDTGGGGGGGGGGGDCSEVVLAGAISGGCNVRLVTPGPCDTVDLRNGAAYEFAWTTDGTNCETPWELNIAGDVTLPNNAYVWSLSENVEAGISRTGGVVYVTAAELEGLRSSNGVFHWTVSSYYGSRPDTVGFNVLR